LRLLKLTILYICINSIYKMESNTNEIEQQPIEQQPIEQQPIEQQPIEQQSIEQQPIEQQQIEQQGDSVVSSLIGFIEGEFVNILVQMVNEFDLVFDYIDKTHIRKLKKYIKTLVKSDVLDIQMKEFMNYISKYEKNMQIVINSKKIKSQDLLFLNEIQLFNGFDFGIFKDENKSTKKTIIQYLYNMFMSCQFVMSYKTDFIQESDALKKFTEIMSLKFTKEQEQQEQELAQQASSSKTPKKERERKVGNSPFEQLGDIGNVFNDILANKDIMNLATDISKDLQDQKIDPMMIMSGLLTGKPSPMLNNLVNKITNKLETKMQSGEIDKRVFEEQAKNVLNAVNKTDLNNVLNAVNKTDLNNVLNKINKKH
jgi:hypothetical protein